MRKIIFCLLLFNVLFFIFSTSFVSADIVDLTSLPNCVRYEGGVSIWPTEADKKTDCDAGSYTYLHPSKTPSAGERIQVQGGTLRITYIFFKGTGSITLYGKNGEKSVHSVSSDKRSIINVNGHSFVVYGFEYSGIDLLGFKFIHRDQKHGGIIAYNYFHTDTQNYYSMKNASPSKIDSFKPVEDKPSEDKPSNENSNSFDCDICSKIDAILEQLKKGNSNGCDICSKMNALLDDINKINNNISQIKITTGYMNSKLSQIKDLISDNSLILAKVRQTLDTIRMQDLDRNDSLDSIDNKLDNLESIDNNLEGIKGEIDTIVDDFAPTITPDFSGQIQKPDLPVLDIPIIEKKEDTNIYFTEQEFDGEAKPFPFAQGPKPWRNVDGKEILIEDFDMDESLIRDDLMEPEEMEREFIERDEPLIRDDLMEREEMEREFIERDEPLIRDDLMEREEMEREFIERDEPLRRDEPLELEEIS